MMPKASSTVEMFKPGYEGPRPKGQLAPPERPAMALARKDLVRRIHDAFLTLNVMPRAGPRSNLAGGSPPYIVEFSDRVGQEVEELRRAQFEPTPAQASDMLPALELMKGLSRPFHKVVLLRALTEFAVERGETEPFTWEEIGQECGGMSARWAEDAYDAAMVQAARRAGILPLVGKHYGLVVVAFWADRGWLSSLETAADPRQTVSNAKARSPLRPDQAYIVWVPGRAEALAVRDAMRSELRGRHSHGAFFKVHPDAMADTVIATARKMSIEWTFEEVAVKGAMAA